MEVVLPDGRSVEFPDGTSQEVMGKAVRDFLLKSSVAEGEKRAVSGAEVRSKAPEAKLDASAFRRVEEIPSEMPAPGAPGGPPPRAAALAIPAMASMAPMAIGSPLATLATTIAGYEGGEYGGRVAKRAGLPPIVGQVAGSLAGGISPALIARKAMGPLASMVAKVGMEQASKQAPAVASAAESPAVTAIAESIGQKLTAWKGMGLSPGQMASSLRETAGFTREAAKKLVKTFEESLVKKAPILPTGSRTMPTNYGGPAQPAPAQAEGSLEDLLRQSIEAYRMK